MQHVTKDIAKIVIYKTLKYIYKDTYKTNEIEKQFLDQLSKHGNKIPLDSIEETASKFINDEDLIQDMMHYLKSSMYFEQLMIDSKNS